MPLQSAARANGRVEQLLTEVEGQIEYLFARYRIPPPDAEDLLQDSLLAYVLKADEIQSPAPWLLQTLKNQCISFWRKRRRWLYEEIDDALLRDSEQLPHGSAETEDWRCDLSRAISRLPERCRSILQLRYRFGFDTLEMADRLGYREGSVRKAEMRCISALTREIVEPSRERKI